MLVQAKTARTHPLLKRSAALGYYRRWWSILSVALKDALSASLLERAPAVSVGNAAEIPTLSEILQEGSEWVGCSRLGWRCD